MKFGLLTISLLLLTNTLSAQEWVDTEEMVGFACYYEGAPSKTVKMVTRKLRYKRYKMIAGMLTSPNNAERFMAVISLEKLAELEMYEITAKQNKLIVEIKNSDQLVSMCSGCTLFQKLALKDMFSDKMYLFASNWIDFNFKE